MYRKSREKGVMEEEAKRLLERKVYRKKAYRIPVKKSLLPFFETN